MISRLALVAFVLMATIAPGAMASAFAGERATSASDATVLIRMVGAVRAEIDYLGNKSYINRDRIELGTGTGFVISPDGHVLTNDHVVSNREIRTTEGLQKIVILLKVSTIEVCFSPEVVAARGGGPACLEASVLATSPALDLAVLSVNSANSPYLALGDSDAATAGQPVQALGFPYGRQLDIAREAERPPVPEITTTSGTISAVRADDAGERRFLQLDANINPGNSGGPLVNRDGFVIGVIQSRLKDASSIGFAIPINQAKTFLESFGVDQSIPGRRLRLGSTHRFDAKGLALRVPDGLTDVSPIRSRLETEPTQMDVALRVDRVMSPWSINRLEQELVTTQAFERLTGTISENRTQRVGGVPAIVGRAAANSDDGKEMAMTYAILDLGREKLVARFVGPLEQLAFNESVLKNSLASLEAERLLTGEMEPVETLRWSSVPQAERHERVPVPAGWVVEPGGPARCRGLSNAQATGTVVAARDFTVVLRVATWSNSAAANEAASACSTRRGSLGDASYATRAEWLGVPYSIEGVFARVGDRMLQLEVLSSEQKAGYARSLLAAWLRKATE